MLSLPRGKRRLYLDITEQISQGHFLLTAASALNEEVIPQGVFLSCDLPIDMLHTSTHTHTQSHCEGCAENVWVYNKRPGHSQTERLHFSSLCYKAAENNQQPSESCGIDPPTNHGEVKKVLPHVRRSAFLKFPSSRHTSSSQYYNHPARSKKIRAAALAQFVADDNSTTGGKAEECYL